MSRSAPDVALDARLEIDLLATQYRMVRQFTEFLCAPLCPEDCVVQSMPDASPTRWHLAHVTWFFETFILREAGLAPYNDGYALLFNSYYNALGPQFPRDRRGVLSRPTLKEVFAYRRATDERILRFLEGCDPERDLPRLKALEIGLHHEQQHQELILTDIKHALSCNPLYPPYRSASAASAAEAPALGWRSYEEGLREIGHSGDGFAYDNETPRHRVFLESYGLADRLVTNGEFLQFMQDGGYCRPELWLSLGWQHLQQHAWQAPLHWLKRDGAWHEFTLGGLRPLDLNEPVCHVSYFEADALARWWGARLPSEAEWECAAAEQPIDGAFAESQRFHPQAAANGSAGERPPALAQVFGEAWQWTSSAYSPYPGYQPPPGALGEYNGKFMCNQFVLRGGSCATPRSHMRASYRNFFPPEARWQFTGIRLAR